MFDLYSLHNNADKLAGYKAKESVPQYVFKQIIDLRNYALMAEELEKYRNILKRDPMVAFRSESLYRTANTMRGVQSSTLFNRSHEVERTIAQDPDAIAAYMRWIVGHVDPQYHEQILKSSSQRLADYVITFSKELKTQHTTFLDRALDKIVTDPQQSYEVALIAYPHERIPKLEPGIFKYDHDPADWAYLVSERETREYPRTPDVDDDLEYITSSNQSEYGEYDSPWNLYVSGLSRASERRAAIKQYGFKGKNFRLGYGDDNT